MKRKTFHVLNRKGASIWEKIDTKTILVKTTKNDDDEKNEKISKQKFEQANHQQKQIVLMSKRKKMSKSVQISKSPFFWFGVSINKKDLNVTSKFKQKKFWKKEFFELKQSCENLKTRILEKTIGGNFFFGEEKSRKIFT